MGAEGWTERARALYEEAVFGGDDAALAAAGRELDAVEAGLSLARGRIAHARFLRDGEEDAEELPLFLRARGLYRSLGDARGEAEAVFWLGTYHQVVRHDHDTALPLLERSYALANAVGDRLTASYAARHLGIAAHAAGRLDVARERLEESTRLRRELGFLPGVAANLVGLAHVALDEGRPGDAEALAAEAAELAAGSGAEAILRQVEEARARLAASSS
ncbi:tetratricopeptide repeat protein [Nonomuraea rhodomycinica]|uniref:Tetratricopeptide repeat protein n=1 Tax=Nonomuraea rhodomycinica TaxID=1712872 RepID=A0A7Y6IIM5_9ACTN|nr:tetratricopeptide repeat protein [Nonomuraea rhodomycinica]NUW38925.1 tetratricopeptide repeat protein [Nonomuraea rhodomycinica]